MDEGDPLGAKAPALAEESWLRYSNGLMRFALQKLSAPYLSPPCTVVEGHVYLAQEFQSRMDFAASALAAATHPNGTADVSRG